MPLELKFLRILNKRKELNEKERKYLDNLEQGFLGESEFDRWLTDLEGDFTLLNDVQIEHNNTIFQIDFLLIITNKIYLFEVKNFLDDFCLEGERWLTKTGTEIKNPLLQLKRCESLLRQCIHPLG